MADYGDDGGMDGQDGHSVPEAEKARLALAWKAAHYFVSIGHDEWLYKAGQTAPDVERQLGAGRYLFITAWNPPPGERDRADNRAADERLQSRLHALRLRHYPSLGCNAQGGAIERGWLVLDCPLEQADALGREFGQGGTLAWRAGEPVRLRMLWARPDCAQEDPHTDWVG